MTVWKKVVTSVIFPLQLHIVHMNQHYTDLTTALADPEGVAVLGFFYEVNILNPVLLKSNCFYRTDLELEWNVCISIFRGPIVQIKSMTPSSTLWEASKLRVSAEVHYKHLKTWLHSSAAKVSSVAFLFSDGNTSLPPVSLAQLIPSEQNLTTFYRYKGSLTTPGCTESVIWTLFENPIPLNIEQVRIKDQKMWRNASDF